MNFEPRCIVVDRAHLDTLPASPGGQLASEIEAFKSSSDAQYLFLSIPTPTELKGTTVSSPEQLREAILLAYRTSIPTGRVDWVLQVGEPAKTELDKWLKTAGKRKPGKGVH